MNDLKELAVNSQMIPNAPILATEQIIIHATKEEIWKVLTNVNAWDSWYPYLKEPYQSDTLNEDIKVEYGGLFRHKLVVGKIEPKETIVFYGRFVGYNGIVKWELIETKENEVLVRFSESSSGPLIKLFYSNAKMKKHLNKWLLALKYATEG